MIRTKLLTVIAVAGLTMPVWASADLSRRSAEGAKVDAQAAFARLKSLEGTWVAPEKDGKRATTTFEVVGNGSVVMEHYTNPALPGNGHMMTAYHLDGAELILTHYCIAQNQPTLRAERYDAATGEMQFEFVRATNLPTAATGHMRRAMYRITDANHFTTEWEYFKDGTRQFTESETFTRSK
jgi:hypothetical protein